MKKRISILFALLLAVLSLHAQDINKMDAKCKRDGVWKGTYEESKRPRYEGTFVHGKETGTFKFFDDTKESTLLATRQFNADGSCYTTFFDPKGNKVSEGKEVNKLQEGEWKYYHLGTKIIMSTEKYAKGKLTGARLGYFSNSKLAEETNYTNGIKNGPYKKYTEKGILLEDATYKNDEFNGPATYKDVEGNLVATGQFTNGKKTGIWKFYEKGKVVREENKSAKPARKSKN